MRSFHSNECLDCDIQTDCAYLIHFEYGFELILGVCVAHDIDRISQCCLLDAGHKKNKSKNSTIKHLGEMEGMIINKNFQFVQKLFEYCLDEILWAPTYGDFVHSYPGKVSSILLNMRRNNESSCLNNHFGFQPMLMVTPIEDPPVPVVAPMATLVPMGIFQINLLRNNTY